MRGGAARASCALAICGSNMKHCSDGRNIVSSPPLPPPCSSSSAPPASPRRCCRRRRRNRGSFASTLGPHVWSSRRPTLPRTEIPPRQPPNARKKKSEHRERHRHPHDTAAVSSKSRNFFWGLQNLRKSRKRSEGSLRHCSCVKQRRCQLRPQKMPHRQ